MAKFITVKGSSTLSTSPFYIGVPQHERIMTKSEAYQYSADRIGYAPTAIRAAFEALAKYIRLNQEKGNASQVDGIATMRNIVKGWFATSTGPWVKGNNLLVIGAIELDPFKNALAGIIPENMTSGANPIINTVFDSLTGLYDVITGTNSFSVAGVDLGPDTTKTDEYVALVSKTGVETKCTITYSDLGNVTANLATALTAGEYTLEVHTRSGLGSEYGVHVASRKITVA